MYLNWFVIPKVLLKFSVVFVNPLTWKTIILQIFTFSPKCKDSVLFSYSAPSIPLQKDLIYIQGFNSKIYALLNLKIILMSPFEKITSHSEKCLLENSVQMLNNCLQVQQLCHSRIFNIRIKSYQAHFPNYALSGGQDIKL